MKKMIGIILAVIMCGTAFGANYNYNGNGTNPNDWFDAGNWSGGGGATNWPTTADNALFVGANTHMIISTVVPEHSQLQVGRGTANEVTIAAGGVVTNLNQTVAGIVNNGQGSLVIDGGTLVTKQIQINTFGGGTVLSPDSNMKVKGGSVHVLSTGVGFKLGVNEAATLEISGGTVVADSNLDLIEGTIRMKGTNATVSIGTVFNFGMAAAKSVNLEFALGADGGVSKISADSITFNGIRTLTIDGTFAETSAEQTLVLIELTGSDTFSAGELAALSDELELINVSEGSLSLSGDSKQLIFTGKPVARELMKAWEFNTIGDTEGWDDSTTKTSYVGVVTALDIDGVEGVLTCSNVVAGDGNLFYNQNQAPAGHITREGKSWRTMEIRLRQIDANPDEPGVDSMQFDPQGTVCVLQQPVVITSPMRNYEPDCDVALDGDDWVIVTYDISELGANDLQSLRIDPIGNDATTNFNFEIDYVRLYAGPSQPPVTRQVIAWEFNTLGDAEGWFGVNMTGVTASNDAVEGVEGVMTCSDVTSVDPQSKYTNTVSIGDGAFDVWDTLEFRARQLTGDPGAVGTTSQVWDISGTIILVQGNNLGGLSDAVEGITITEDTNHWVIGTVDLSAISGDLNNFRLDFVGGDADLNVEVDYIRIYKYERQTPYEFWAEQQGLGSTNSDPNDDPDSDTYNNLYEYAFGGDPLDDQVFGAAPFSAGASGSVLDYVYLKNASPYNELTYSLEYTDDLVNGTWSNLTGAVVSGIGAYTSDLNAVTNQIATDLPAKFIRTKVE